MPPATLRRAFFAVMAFCIWSAGENAEAGVPLRASAKIARTRAYVGNTVVSRIWASDTLGNLLSRFEGSTAPWTNWVYMPGGYPVSSRGVTALSYDVGADVHTRVYFVGTNGVTTRLYELLLVNGVFSSWMEFNPGSITPGGEIEAFTSVTGTTRYVAVLFYATNGNVYRYWKSLTGAWMGPTLSNTSPCVGVYNGPIASAVIPDEVRGQFFVQGAPPLGNQIFAITLYGGAWSCTNLGAPTSTAVPSSMDADAGAYSGTSGAVRVYVTPIGATYDLWMKASTNGGVTWGSWTSLGASTVSHTAYGVATTHRASAGATDRFETFVLDTATPPNLWKHAYETTNLGWTSLGPLDECTSLLGGLVAHPDTGNTEIAYLIGRLGIADYLVSRTTASGTGPWFVHGSGYRVSPLLQNSLSSHAETFVSDRRGSLYSAGVVRPIPPDPAFVETTWSFNDGLNDYTAVEPPRAKYAEPSNYYDYVSDATTAITSSGAGYVLALGVEWPSDPVCTDPGLPGVNTNTNVYYNTTTNGLYSGSPITIATSPGINDHPWMALDRPGNKLHIVWRPPTQVVNYCTIDLTSGVSTCAAPVTLPAPMGGPPVVVLDAAGTPFVTSNPGGAIYLCRVAPASDGQKCCVWDPTQLCGVGLNVPVNMSNEVAGMDESDVTMLDVIGCHQNTCLGGRIRTEGGWALATSPAVAGRLYYATHAGNFVAPGSGKDIVVSRSWFDGRPGTWTAPVTPGSSYPTDDTDQFFPAISVSYSGNQDQLFVNWYDRRFDVGGCHNHFIWPMYAVSGDSGSTWWGADFLRDPQDATNPCSLPVRCFDGTLFIGDYHSVAGEKYHTHVTLTEAVAGSYVADPWEAFMGARDYDGL